MSNVLPIGGYEVLHALGEGANSKILHIRRRADNRSYALKVVPINGAEDRKYLEQAQHEFRVGQMLDHPCLLKVYALEIAKNWLFQPRKAHLLLEYVPGKTLDTAPPIPLAMMVQVFEKIAAGLVHMHRRNVFHGDLKPSNIMIARGGVVKVIDFGLAFIRGENKARIQGTPEYMAPEQIKNKIANEKTDIYNLGATMYRMVTLRLPPSCMPEDGMRVDSKTLKKLLQPVQEFNTAAPPLLCDLIHNCLAPKPEQRPERMSEVQGTLDHIAERMIESDVDRLEMMEW